MNDFGAAPTSKSLISPGFPWTKQKHVSVEDMQSAPCGARLTGKLTARITILKGACVANYSEFFIADHHQAVARAKARQGGKSPAIDVPVLPTPGLSDFEIEVLGEYAVKKVHARGVASELSLVDIELDNLFAVPDALLEVFAELDGLEDQEEVSELAAEWAAAEEMESTPAVTEPLVRALAAMSVAAVKAAEDNAKMSLFFYSAE